MLISMAWNLHPFYFEKPDELLKDLLVLPLSSCSILSKFLMADLLSFLLLISMAWNINPFCFEKLDEVLKDSLVLPLRSSWNPHPFCFEKLDEILKDSLVLPLSSCRSVQPKMLFFALPLNHDTAESARVCWNIWHAIKLFQAHVLIAPLNVHTCE
ncbi:hypothetical protein Tco_1049847 [Tanacetum coccineum]